MKPKGDSIISLVLIIIGTGAVIMAMQWSFKAALYPLAIGIPLIVMATAEFLLSVYRKKEVGGKNLPSESVPSDNADERLVDPKNVSIFLWIISFFLMIYLIGFTIAAPLMIFLYLKFESKERWAITLILTASAWIFFYVLFIWLTETPFPDGLFVEFLTSLWSG